MQRIGRERRQLARVQTARTLTAGAMGATEGATAAQAFLAANPAHSYERDRARFFQALESATPLMQAALTREHYVRQINYRIASDNLAAAQEIMGQKAAASRTNSQLDAARAEDEAGVALGRLNGQLSKLYEGSELYQGAVGDYLNSLGMDPDVARAQGTRGSGGGGGTGGSRATSGYIDLLRGAQPLSVQDLRGGEFVPSVESGAIMITDAAGTPVTGSSTNYEYLNVLSEAPANATDEELINRARQEGIQGDDATLRAGLNKAAALEITIMDRNALPDRIQTQLNTATLSALGGGTGTGGTPTQADIAEYDEQRFVLGMSQSEFDSLSLNPSITPGDFDRLASMRQDQYQRGAAFVAGMLAQPGDVGDVSVLTDALKAVDDTAQAQGLNREEVWEAAKQIALQNLPADQRPQWANMNLAMLQAQVSDETQQFQDEAYQEVSRIRADFQRAGVQDQETLDMMDGLAGLVEQQATGTRNRQQQVQETVMQEADAAPEEPAPAEEGGAPEAVEDEQQAVLDATRRDLDAQRQANEERLKRGKVLVYGMEVDADRVPDDIGGQVMLMWELASEYPQHPPLQQAIQDQMNSPEFAEWMESRGHTGTPNKLLFREFQREYRVARRMNRVRQRRQIQMNRMAQNRLGQAPSLDTPAPPEIQEEGVFTRQRGREYRAEARQATQEARRDYRQELQDREGAQQPGMLQGMRQPRRQQQQRRDRPSLPGSSLVSDR